MDNILVATPLAVRRRPLAACVASLFALTTPAAAIANTWIVNSCDGDANTGTIATKTGTLRFAIANAAPGDTVELGGLTGGNACPASKISLATGSLSIAQSSLRLHGPGAAALQIDASLLPRTAYVDNRVLTHIGNATLTIDSLGITGGYVNHHTLSGYGGCVYSHGNVKLQDAVVSACIAYSEYNTARGGAIFAAGYANLTNSTVSGGGAISQTGTAFGAGVFAAGNVSVLQSTISGNGTKSGGSSAGGGIYANGNLVAVSTSLSANSLRSYAGTVAGGGIYTKGSVTLQLSIISANQITPGPGMGSKGGGVETLGNFFSSYSTISDNKAYGTGYGGGLHLAGAVNTIFSSTISGNVSYASYGGIDVFTSTSPGTNAFQIVNSTISGNHAVNSVGGLFVNSGTARFYNSTIAFNTAAAKPGVELNAFSSAMSVTLQSTLMSNNTFGTFEDDLSSFSLGNPITINGGIVATPANNLIRVTSVSGLPNDTLNGFCPHLGRLRNNGGLTRTHALSSHSVAIDAGNTFFFGSPPYNDQRGPASVNGTADYPRISGMSGLADIGAYEVQQDDIVFDTDFEDCVPPPV